MNISFKVSRRAIVFFSFPPLLRIARDTRARQLFARSNEAICMFFHPELGTNTGAGQAVTSFGVRCRNELLKAERKGWRRWIGCLQTREPQLAASKMNRRASCSPLQPMTSEAKMLIRNVYVAQSRAVGGQRGRRAERSATILVVCRRTRP